MSTGSALNWQQQLAAATGSSNWQQQLAVARLKRCGAGVKAGPAIFDLAGCGPYADGLPP